MARDSRVGERAAAATLLGIVLLNPPLVDLFDRGALVAGIPAPVAYVFGAWAALIGLLAWTMRPRPAGRPDDSDAS